MDITPPSAVHWAVGIIAPILVAAYGIKKRSLDGSGVAAGLVVGFILSVSSFSFLASLLATFLFGSKATKFRSYKKKKIEADFKEGGQRNWIQVICNAGPASFFAILYILEVGCVNLPIDFSLTFSASWYAVAVISSLACACGDTFASEFGTVLGESDPRHVLTWRKVPRGTNGGVSALGTLASVVGGAVVGVASYFTTVTCCQWVSLTQAPAQWPVLLYAVCAGFLGSMIDSVLGSTLQYSGKHKKHGYILESDGPDIEHISGLGVLDNHSVNFLACLITGAIMPAAAAETWHWFSISSSNFGV